MDSASATDFREAAFPMFYKLLDDINQKKREILEKRKLFSRNWLKLKWP